MSWFAWALVAAFFWGAAPVAAKIGLVKADPLIALTIRTTAIIVSLFLVNLLAGRAAAYRELDTKTWLVLAAEGIFASGIGHYAYFAALQQADAGTVSPVTSTFPLVAILLGALVLGERLTGGKIGGAALIILGVLVIRKF